MNVFEYVLIGLFLFSGIRGITLYNHGAEMDDIHEKIKGYQFLTGIPLSILLLGLYKTISQIYCIVYVDGDDKILMFVNLFLLAYWICLIIIGAIFIRVSTKKVRTLKHDSQILKERAQGGLEK